MGDDKYPFSKSSGKHKYPTDNRNRSPKRRIGLSKEENVKIQENYNTYYNNKKGMENPRNGTDNIGIKDNHSTNKWHVVKSASYEQR